jgi:hypothetical protein
VLKLPFLKIFCSYLERQMQTASTNIDMRILVENVFKAESSLLFFTKIIKSDLMRG